MGIQRAVNFVQGHVNVNRVWRKGGVAVWRMMSFQDNGIGVMTFLSNLKLPARILNKPGYLKPSCTLEQILG